MNVDFASLAHQCAPNVNPATLQAVVKTESGFNPYAIGVVGGHLVRQPKSHAEAVATAKALEAKGLNFSLGLGQVNKKNLAAQGLTYESAFDPCSNLRAEGNILSDCYRRAAATKGTQGRVLNAAFSCYYSGNFVRGFQPDYRGTSYVQRIAANANGTQGSVEVVPAIPVVMDRAPQRKGEKPATDDRPAADTVSPASNPGSDSRQRWDAFGDLSSPK